MLKILQISNKAPFPANDGSSIAIFNMAKGILANGAELHLLTINTKKHFKPDEGVPEEFRRQSHYRSVYRNTDTTKTGAFLNLFTRDSYFVSRFHFQAFSEALAQKLQEVEFDIIQIEGLFMGVYIPLIRQHSRGKIVLRAHNVEYLIWERHLAVERSRLKRMYLSLQTRRLRKFEEKVLSQVDAVVSITDADRKLFTALVKGKPMFTCITGVEVEHYKISTKAKDKTLFIFSSMDWMPNQEAVDWFLNNCWETVRKAVPECRLVIAGRNMPKRLLSVNLPNTLVIEQVKSAAEFYSSWQIMLVPLLSGSGLRIKIIEGMAYGKAIISTTIGAEGIHVSSGKEIILADGAQEFSAAVIALLNDEAKRKEMELSARRFAEEYFDNRTVVAPLLDFYKKLNA